MIFCIMKGVNIMSGLDDTTYGIIEVFIKIARFIVDLIVSIANGEEIKMPDLGGLGGFLPTKPN